MTNAPYLSDLNKIDNEKTVVMTYIAKTKQSFSFEKPINGNYVKIKVVRYYLFSFQLLGSFHEFTHLLVFGRDTKLEKR